MPPLYHPDARLSPGPKHNVENPMRKQGLWHAPDIRSARSARLSIVCSALLLSLVWLSPATAQGLPEWRSAHSGVYTEEQAAEGAEIHNTVCTKCHTDAHPLKGTKFMSIWGGRSLWKLYEFVSLNMPYGLGGTLSSTQYSAAISYILKMNGYPAGTAPLSEVPLEIAYISLDPHPKPKGALTTP